jgi:hypothetical protein
MGPDPACGRQVGTDRQTQQDCVCFQESATLDGLYRRLDFGKRR